MFFSSIFKLLLEIRNRSFGFGSLNSWGILELNSSKKEVVENLLLGSNFRFKIFINSLNLGIKGSTLKLGNTLTQKSKFVPLAIKPNLKGEGSMSKKYGIQLHFCENQIEHKYIYSV